MQRELYADLINLLIKADVYVEPDLSTVTKGIHPLTAKFILEDGMLFSALELSYVPDNSRRRWFTYYRIPEQYQGKGKRELVERGYNNYISFLKQFVQSGGKLVIASDAQHFVPPGISIHQEMELLVREVGLSPMQAIERATKRPAEFLGHLQDSGTIEYEVLPNVRTIIQPE